MNAAPVYFFPAPEQRKDERPLREYFFTAESPDGRKTHGTVMEPCFSRAFFSASLRAQEVLGECELTGVTLQRPEAELLERVRTSFFSGGQR